MSIVKKISFEELYATMDCICKKIDETFTKMKVSKKGKKIYDGYGNYKVFLKSVEAKAIRETATEMGITESAVKERWKIMILPYPVYNALEHDEVCFSKVKPLTSISFDMDSDKDIEIAQKLLNEIKKGVSADEVKKMVKKESVNIWNSQSIMVEKMAEQNGINAEAIC